MALGALLALFLEEKAFQVPIKKKTLYKTIHIRTTYIFKQLMILHFPIIL